MLVSRSPSSPEGAMTENEIEWREPETGFELTPEPVMVTREHQDEKLTACGLDPAQFGDAVDPSFYIGLAIQCGIRSGIPAEGNINMLTRLIQHRPVKLGEELTFRGYIKEVKVVPRGRAVSTEAWFEDASGKKVISVPRKSLRPDPAKRGASGAGDRPPPVIEDPAVLKELGRHSLTPEAVKSYSSEGNSIHYEMEAANRAGFRAPIIGGGMGVHYLLAALWQTYQPESLDLDVFFRRPIFWDDSFAVAHAAGEPWDAISLVREGKVLTEAGISSIR